MSTTSSQGLSFSVCEFRWRLLCCVSHDHLPPPATSPCSLRTAPEATSMAQEAPSVETYSVDLNAGASAWRYTVETFTLGAFSGFQIAQEGLR